MTAQSSGPVTKLLSQVGRGEPGAADRLWAVIYDELRIVARRQLADEAAGHRRRPTSLVHEAYIRLTANQEVQWTNRRHFFAAAAKAMRRIRIDDARKRKRFKRGGTGVRPPPPEGAGHPDGEAVSSQPSAFSQSLAAESNHDPAEVLAVDEALAKLEQHDPRKAEVVMLRYFAGLTVEECAEALGLSPRTVRNEWRFARTWLHRQLKDD